MKKLFVIFCLLFIISACSVEDSDVVDNNEVIEEGNNNVDCNYDYEYLMSFQACDSSLYDCSAPINHQIYFAGSNDGDNWELIEEWQALGGSVADLAYYDNSLLMFVPTSGGFRPNIIKINSCFEIVEEFNFDLIDSNGEKHGYVDPSAYVFDDQLYMAHLYTEELGPAVDLTGCDNNYPCDKSMYIAVPKNDDFTEFEIIDNAGLTLELTGIGSGGLMGISDPDIFQLADGSFVMLVSSGSNVYAFVSDSIDEEFKVENDLLQVSKDQGGVPSGILVDGKIWVYVNYYDYNAGGVDVIRKAVLNSIEDEPEFYTVLDGESLFGNKDIIVGSPSILLWPW